MLLARTLGRTLDELGASMTAEEYGVWGAEYARQAWDDGRLDLSVRPERDPDAELFIFMQSENEGI